MRLAQACPLVTALVLAFQFSALAGPDADPRAHAADASPGGQRDHPGPVRVVLVRSADADPITAEALIRIQGELAAEGFSVVLVDAPTATPEHPPEGQREHVADEGGASGLLPRAGVAGATPPVLELLPTVPTVLERLFRVPELRSTRRRRTPLPSRSGFRSTRRPTSPSSSSRIGSRTRS